MYDNNNFKNRFMNHCTGMRGETKTVLQRKGLVRNEFPNIVTIPYSNKINCSQEAIDFINEFLNGTHGNAVIAAETGAGKTYWIANAFHKNSNERVEEYGFVGKKNINILCVPNRNQAEQAGRQYNLPAIIGGVEITRNDILVNDGFITVYDKITEVIEFMKRTKNFDEDYKVNLIIDEAHNLIEASSYRPLCIKNVLKCIDEVVNRQGNVAYMSASFEVLDIFDVDTMVCLYNKKEVLETTNTSIICKNSNLNVETFLANEIAREIKNGNPCYIRYQRKNKSVADCDNGPLTTIKNAVEGKLNKELSMVVINRDEAENGSEALQTLIKDSYLPKADIYFCTSMVDAGTNIVGIIDNDGSISQPKNIVPMFLVDSNSCVIDNIEQSFNRFRWELTKRKVLLCPNTEIEEIHFGRTLHNNLVILQNFQNMYNDNIKRMLAFCDVSYMEKEILKQIGTDEEMLTSKCLKYNKENMNVELSVIDLYRFTRNNYMKQFLNPAILKMELERVLGGNIEYDYQEANSSTAVEKIDSENLRKEFFSNMKEDLKRIITFDKKEGQDWNIFAGTDICELYAILRKKNEPTNIVNMFATMTNKEIIKVAKDTQKGEMKQLNKNDFVAIDKILNNEKICISYNDILVADILYGLYKEEIKKLFLLTGSAKKTIEIIISSNNDTTTHEKIKQLKCIDINRRYMKGLNPCNKSELEQYTLIRAIENEKCYVTSLSLTKDSDKLADIAMTMTAKLEGEKFTTSKVFKMIKRIYKTKVYHNTGITIYELKL